MISTSSQSTEVLGFVDRHLDNATASPALPVMKAGPRFFSKAGARAPPSSSTVGAPLDGTVLPGVTTECAPAVKKARSSCSKPQPPTNTSFTAVGLPGAKPDVTGVNGAAAVGLPLDGTVAEPVEPYPLTEPCYQRVGQFGNCLVYSGNTLAPPLQ